jgi:hypothetical protein
MGAKAGMGVKGEGEAPRQGMMQQMMQGMQQGMMQGRRKGMEGETMGRMMGKMAGNMPGRQMGASNPATLPTQDSKVKKNRHVRTEFVVFFVWREPTPSDKLLPQEPSADASGQQ